MKMSYKIVILLFSFLSITLVAEDSISDFFRVPYSVHGQTKLKKEVDVFYYSTSCDLDIPDQGPSINLLEEVGYQYDPIEGYNRVMFAANDYINTYLFFPTSLVIDAVLPKYMRKGIENAAFNIEMPGRLLNCFMQERFKRSGIEFSRFLINTTLGIGGFYDPARAWFSLEPKYISFGQSLENWNVGPMCFFVIPIQGGSTIRDIVGLAYDYLADPITYIPPLTVFNWVSMGIKLGLRTNDMTLRIDDYLKLYESASDPYTAYKQIWYFIDLANTNRID